MARVGPRVTLPGMSGDGLLVSAGSLDRKLLADPPAVETTAPGESDRFRADRLASYLSAVWQGGRDESPRRPVVDSAIRRHLNAANIGGLEWALRLTRFHIGRSMRARTSSSMRTGTKSRTLARSSVRYAS